MFLELDGKKIASMTCTYPTICGDPVTVKFNPIKYAKSGSVLSFAISCAGDPTQPDACQQPDPIKAKITIAYEIATP